MALLAGAATPDGVGRSRSAARRAPAPWSNSRRSVPRSKWTASGSRWNCGICWRWLSTDARQQAPGRVLRPPRPGSNWSTGRDSRRPATPCRIASRRSASATGACHVDTRNIRSVRFHPPSPELDRQWREIVAGSNRGDVAVLRRSKTSLDQLEGVFHDITEEAVEFEYDEQRIAVKPAKLEGIVYFHAVARRPAESRLRRAGDRWFTVACQVAGTGGRPAATDNHGRHQLRSSR